MTSFIEFSTLSLSFTLVIVRFSVGKILGGRDSEIGSEGNLKLVGLNEYLSQSILKSTLLGCSNKGLLQGGGSDVSKAPLSANADRFLSLIMSSRPINRKIIQYVFGIVKKD